VHGHDLAGEKGAGVGFLINRRGRRDGVRVKAAGFLYKG
jgi:hypothetical protein